MNRAQRRANGNRLPARITKLIACPDCDSDTTLGDCGHLEVRHDETCPWYTALKRAGNVVKRRQPPNNRKETHQ